MNNIHLLGVFTLLTISPLLYADNISVFIGTSGPYGDGIYQTFFNTENGKFSEVERVVQVKSPNFLALHPAGDKIYAVCRWSHQAGVIGYQISKEGKLKEFTRMDCPDGMGCHIAVHPDGKFLLTAQYSGGSVAFFGLEESGKLNRPAIIEHRGSSGVIGGRQDNPHPHWCGYSPCGNFALVPDLGLDQITIYKVDDNRSRIFPHGHVNSPQGAGPRHMKFSTDGKWIYLLNELSLSISSFYWESESGRAAFKADTPTLSDQLKERESFNSAAEILTHPNGKWIYSSNRGHDSISFFESDDQGFLLLKQVQPIRGAFPRNVNLSPCGTWLLAAGQDSGTISAHKIDRMTGELTYQRGSIVNAPNPVCLLFKTSQ